MSSGAGVGGQRGLVEELGGNGDKSLEWIAAALVSHLDTYSVCPHVCLDLGEALLNSLSMRESMVHCNSQSFFSGLQRKGRQKKTKHTHTQKAAGYVSTGRLEESQEFKVIF